MRRGLEEQSSSRPGEVEADRGVIEVGSFESHGDGAETKTGHRSALQG